MSVLARRTSFGTTPIGYFPECMNARERDHPRFAPALQIRRLLFVC